MTYRDGSDHMGGLHAARDHDPLITPSAPLLGDPMVTRSGGTPATESRVAGIDQDVNEIRGRINKAELRAAGDNEQHRRGVVIVGVIAVAALILVIIAGMFVYGTRSAVSDLSGRQTADETQQARINDLNHNAICQSYRALISAQNAGTLAGSQQLTALKRNVTALNCGTA
jgi:hypothetical protein